MCISGSPHFSSQKKSISPLLITEIYGIYNLIDNYFIWFYIFRILLESPPPNNLVETDDKKEDGLWNDENNGEAEEEESKAFYNKAKSFFDNISCEAVERSKG